MSLPIGCLAVAFELASLSIAQVAWSPFALALPWVVLAAWTGIACRRELAKTGHRLLSANWNLGGTAFLHSLDRPGAAILLGVGGLLLALAPLGLPAMDGFSAGYFKARFFWANAGIIPFYQNAGDLFYAQPTHPPLVALTIDWLYLITGVNEHATLILWPTLLCSSVMVFYALLRSLTTNRIALWATVAFVLSASDVTMSATNLATRIFH